MAQATANKPGEMKEYISNIEFSLNFENRRDSIKVKVGDIVFYDGVTAKYMMANGVEVVGQTPSLKSAIDSNWLSVNMDEAFIGPVDVKTPLREGIQYQRPQYDSLRGGDINEVIDTTPRGTQVIRDDEQIVKKFEVSGDQVAVKEVNTIEVTSSTVVPNKGKKFSNKIISAGGYGADATIPLKKTGKKKIVGTKKKAFLVDDSTPKLGDDATLEDVRKATTPVKSTENQNAKVVKKIGKKKMPVESYGDQDARVVKKIGEKKKAEPIEPQEARVVKKIGEKKKVVKPMEDQEAKVVKKIGKSVPKKTVEGITMKKVDSPKDMTIKTTVTGSEPVVDLSGSKTQKDVDKAEAKAETKVKSSKKGTKNYLDMLPENWSKMHWVKKEKFILKLDDIEFIKFILTVETVKAVQNACKKRLKQLKAG